MSKYTNETSAHSRKRVRFSGDESSEPSISGESALVPTSVTDQSTDASNYDSDTDSDMSSSSEEPSDDSSSEDDGDQDDDDTKMYDTQAPEQEEVVNLRANRGAKPTMRLDQEELGPDIRSFLKDFLPQLKAANEELEEQKKAGTLKSLDDADQEEEGAPYIEMDLGLGVLEAKDPNAPDSSESESEGEATETETDRLGKLMGRVKKDTASIQIVQDTRTS